MDISYIQASEIREKLCKILYFTRGANAIVLTQYYNESLQYTSQQKKQMTNQLVRLKEAGIITSKKLEGKDAGSMYYLSTTGLELVYKLLNINPMQSGAMWQHYPYHEIQHEQLKEYDYDTYKPPVRQYAHHHLILQSIISLFGKGSNLMHYLFRFTIDAVETYTLKNESRMLKPDIELLVDDEIYALEIDRATESYSQLVAKFQNYKNYIDYASQENVAPPITKIIFVYDDKNSNYGVSRRWETIMKAYLEGIEIRNSLRRWPNVEVLFTKVSDLPSIIKYLLDKKNSEIEHLWKKYYVNKVVKHLQSKNIKSSIFEGDSTITLEEEPLKLIFCCMYPFYTSDLYRQLVKFREEGKHFFKEVTALDDPKLIPIVLGNDKLTNWELNFKNTKVDHDLQVEIMYSLKFAHYYLLEE